MVYQDNRIITLNSQDGELLNGTYLSNIHFNFSGLLKDDKNLIRSYITVINAQIPVSFYIIDETNNILNYTHNSVNKTVELTEGNYNGNQMVTALNTGFTVNGSPITSFLAPQSGILYFFITGGNSITLLSTSTAKKILGFDVNISSTTLIKLPYQLNLLGKKKLFINSNNLRNSAFTSKNLASTQTIAVIPVDQPPYSMINFTSTVDIQKIILNNRVLDMIDIEITDEETNFVNFRNIDWSITLCLTVEIDDIMKIDYGIYNLPQQNNNIIEKNNIENIKKLSKDEKELRLLEN
jgi:hypothetical protein